MVDLYYLLIYVAGMEFIYAQSPNNMKGLQTGMFYLIYGIFSAFGSIVYFGYLRHMKSTNSNTVASDWAVFCIILLSIGVVGLISYMITACCYKNRQRPSTDEADVQHILMYANVYCPKS